MDQIQHKIDKTVDASLAATKRMREDCIGAREAGNQTIVALDNQGGQLDNIEKGMIAINEDMKDAEKTLKGMGKSFLPNPFNKEKKYKEKVRTWNDKEGAGKNWKKQQIRDPAEISTCDDFISNITGDVREKEMEEDMQEVSRIVGDLRNITLDMGNEIENSIKQIDRINAIADSNVGRISIANERARNLL